MFDRIFGNYLVKTGHLTRKQLLEIYDEQECNRVRLGLIAVSEKLMTIEQVDEINKLQAVMDKRFGDIAISKGYLSNKQVDHLLNQQGNVYLVFAQTMIDNNYLSMSELEEILLKFQKDFGYTQTEMDILKSGDIDRIVSLLLNMEDQLVREVIQMFIRTAGRLIDYHIFMKEAKEVELYDSELLSIQELKGSHKIFSAISADEDAMMSIAIGFAGSRFIQDGEDSVDAMCEFLNCVNGLFATKKSTEQLEFDMVPPEYYLEQKSLTSKKMYVVPMVICEKEVDYIIVCDYDVTIAD